MLQIANRRLTEINRTIEAGLIWSDSLLGGQLGLVLYYYNLYEATEEHAYREKALKLLAEVIDNWQGGSTRLVKSSFSSGAAGFAWLMTFLAQRNFIDTDLRTELEELDNYLFEEAVQQLKTESTDYLHGALGIMHYFTLRMNEESIRRYADHMIAMLNEKGIYDDKGFRLHNFFTGKEAPDEINFSVSHGLSGMLLILMNAWEGSDQKSTIQQMVGEGVRYILHYRRDVDFAGGIYNYFPLTVMENSGRLIESNRLAWCYGDLNQVLLLNRAARLLNRENYARLGQLIGLQTLLRTNEQSTLVADSHFCHGSSGLAHFYRELYQLTGHEGYRTGYKQWIEQTLLHIEKELATGKYAGKETNFLEGLVGVALTLLSYVSGKELHWSRSLLL
jgi:lantibiotic biosynthesis protein